MKKILFYIPSLKPSGGIERVVTTIANQLSDIYDITILTQDGKESFYTVNSSIKIDSLNTYRKLNMNNRLLRIISRIKSIYFSISKLSKYLDENNFDYIYHTHPNSQLELLFAGCNKNKIIISEHGASNNYNRVYRLIKYFTYKKCKSYCIPTRTDYDYYHNYNFPVKYIPHYRPQLDYSTCNIDNKIVLNIGRYTDDKKQLTLLNIWKNLNPIIRDGWNLKIVGEGELKDALLSYIETNDLSSSVELLDPIQNIENYYKNASIFALTSRSEGFGMVLLEAAGFGLPLISFNCPSGPKDIINSNNGFLITINDTEKYKNSLEKMMLDKNLLKRFNIGSINLAKEWSNENITKKWKGIFE